MAASHKANFGVVRDCLEESNMPSLDLNLLGALDALLTERNVTRAAERLHVTQPTMSGMLQRLRSSFDDQLLVRNGRAMDLTPLGSSLVDPVREALTRVEALGRVEATFDPATSRRTFSIMTSDYCVMVFMPRVVAQLGKIAPGIRLEFHSLNGPVEKLVSGEVDICISVHDRRLLIGNHADVFLESAGLFTDEFVCIVANDHPLDEYSTLADHLRYPHVGVKVGGTIDTIDTQSMRDLEPLYKPAFVVDDFWLVPGLVASSTLVGVVQSRLAQIAARTYDIRSYRPPYSRPPINETMHWHPRCSADPGHAWLRHMMIAEAAQWLSGE
jgi:LysR family nod box-dependent transcriptional activator